MIILKIGKHRIKMPNKASEISLEKGIQIMNLILEHTPTFQDKIGIISLLSNLDLSIIEKFSEASIENIYSKIEFIHGNFFVRIYKNFKLKGITYGMVDFNDLTVKEYADIDFYLDEGNDIYENLDKIMAILYRPIKSKTQTLRNILLNIILNLRFKGVVPVKYKNYTIVPYTNDKHSSIFLKHTQFEIGFGAIHEYFKFKDQLQKEYKLLFKTEEQEEEIKKLQGKKEFHEIWGYYYVINEISKDIFERTEWWNRNIRELMKYLTFMKQKTLTEMRNGRRS